MNDHRVIHLPEPWLRGNNYGLPVVLLAVTNALDLAKEDVDKWCGDLTFEQINVRPLGLAPVSFHIRHMARSLDRLLTYAEGEPLSEAQLAALASELHGSCAREELLAEWNRSFQVATRRIRAMASADLGEPRGVGRKQLQTSLGALLIHIADHTQRHVGQMVTTVQAVRGMERGM